MRIIDADALINRMYHDAFETDTDMQKWDSGCWIRYKMFENAIYDAPTIDAVEVVRGEWIDYDRYMKCCSKCGWIQDILHFGSKYCPNCGCDMRGEDNE